MKSFVITRVGWMSGRPNMPSDLNLRKRFLTLVRWLQDHELTTRTIATTLDEVDLESELTSEDLTSDGLVFVRSAYDAWAGHMDATHDYEDASVLDSIYRDLVEGH